MREILDKEPNAEGIHMAFVELRARLTSQLGRYGLFDAALAREHVYGSIDAAVRDITPRLSNGAEVAAPTRSTAAEGHPDHDGGMG